jgi:hypothetical protein
MHSSTSTGLSADGVTLRANHASAELVEYLKGCLVATESKLSLELDGGLPGDLRARQTSELRNGKALLQARTSDTKIRAANEWIQGSERKPHHRGIPVETQEAKLESRECPCSRQWQNSISLSSNRISME